MKRIVMYTAVAVSLMLPAVLSAQVANSAFGSGGQTPVGERTGYTMNHVDFGVYADYFRFAPGGNAANYLGLGGRLAFSVIPNLALEAEGNYDFERNYTSTVTTTNGNVTTTTTVTSGLRPITGLFGPKIQFGTSGPFRVFATGKVGLIDFSTTGSGINGGQLTGAVSGIGSPGTFFAIYPGGGFEGFIGPVGIRAEAGDEIYVDNGAHNNLRITAGPTFRF